MTRLLLSGQSFAREYGLPETRQVNLLSEAAPDGSYQSPLAPPSGIREVRFSRPGLTESFAVGMGPIRGMYVSPGVFSGATFTASGTALYSGTTNLGTMPGNDLVRIAASRSQLVALSGGVPYLWDGTTFQAIASAIAPISDIAFIGLRFIYAQANSDRLYWSEINDAANINGLSFATAEDNPDPIVGFQVVGEQLYILGSRSVENWGPGVINSDGTGTPIAPVEGAGYARGCASRDAICAADNAVIWVTDTGIVVRGAQVPGRLSTHYIEERIGLASDISTLTAWTGTIEGHELYVLTIPNVGTWAYDFSRQTWGEWQSYGRPHFRGRCAVTAGGQILVGDDTTNQVGSLSHGVYTDYNGPLTRVASAFFPVEEGSPRCNILALHCVRGVGNSVDPGSEPVVEMRYSDDQGRTFSPWRPKPLGAEGQYALRAVWKRLGLMQAPGRLFEWRVSDPVNAVFVHAEVNPARAFG